MPRIHASRTRRGHVRSSPPKAGAGGARCAGAFASAGLYASAVAALALALLATTAAALLAVLNAAANPRRAWLAAGSLCYWNAAAAFMDLLCLILWGSLFATTLQSSIALNEVISKLYTSHAQLGWSYWLVLVALIVSAANVGVLFWREHLLKREPPPPPTNPDKDVADGTVFLY